jgi:hypothetical protein
MQRKQDALADFAQEKITQELMVEKERSKSERLRIRKDQATEELKQVSNQYAQLHRE